MFFQFESFFANVSFLFLFITMIYYWYQLGSLFPILSVPVLSLSPKTPEGHQSPSFGGESSSSFGTLRGQGSDPLSGGGTLWGMGPNIFVIFSLGALFLLLILRWQESGHFPLSNLYESLIFLSFCCTCLHFITQIYMASTAKFSVLVLTLIGSITSSSALLINAFASFSLPETMQQGGPLVPALQSNWLMMHVTVMILSYAALIIGSLLSICYLIFSEYAKTQKSSFPKRVSPKGSLGGLGGLPTQPTHDSLPQRVDSGDLLVGAPEGHPSYVRKDGMGTTSIETILFNFDNLSYRIIGLGFPLLTIGILSGAVWANEAWGSFWSWDPKETWALLTWFIFAIYLHTRITRGWEGKVSAIMASIGFLTVWVCFLGVNLLGEGLHSYGFLAK